MIKRPVGSKLTLAFATCCLSWCSVAAEPRVVATIKPIHSLVAGVMDGVGAPTLLIRGGGSPHSYSLRPSEARALSRADLVFWVGEEFETFLTKPLAALAIAMPTPTARAHQSGVTFTPCVSIPMMIGIIAAVNGMLSIAAENTADAHIRTRQAVSRSACTNGRM